MTTEYAHALAKSTEDVSKSEITVRVESLVALLKREGKMKALPNILREFVRISERRKAQTPTLHVAHEKNVSQAMKELKTAIDSEKPETKVDDTLIGGWRYIEGDMLIDRSYKTALINLYRNITSA